MRATPCAFGNAPSSPRLPLSGDAKYLLLFTAASASAFARRYSCSRYRSFRLCSRMIYAIKAPCLFFASTSISKPVRFCGFGAGLCSRSNALVAPIVTPAVRYSSSPLRSAALSPGCRLTGKPSAGEYGGKRFASLFFLQSKPWLFLRYRLTS